MRLHINLAALVTAFTIAAPAHTLPAAETPSAHAARLGIRGESLVIDRHPTFLLLPEPANRATPQPWILYAPTLPPYPDLHERWMHEKFVAAGVAVAGID